MGSIEPFNRLVKLAARAFYDDNTTKGENQPKTGRTDNRGIAVVVLDALTRRQWVREEDLAKDLKLHTKQLRRTLRLFEEEKLITREHRKETAKGAKIYNAAVASVGDGQSGREGAEKLKMHTHSYCCLDYSQIYDVLRYRLHRMKKMLKDELESKNTVQEYICPSCSKRYTALDALRLISPYDEYFHCESCNGVLVAESDKLAAKELGDGDDNARRRRHENLKDMLTKLEDQLKPLIDQVGRVKDLAVPEVGSLQAWEVRANAAGRPNGDLNSYDLSIYPQGLGFGATAMGNTQVEVAFSGEDDKGDVKTINNTNGPTKELPPWMITQRMKEQLRAVKPDAANIADASELSDDKKSTTVNDETNNLQDEYVKALKAHYAALLMRQSEPEDETVKKEEASPNAVVSNEVYNNLSTEERQVGAKSKRDDDDVEWEEEPLTGNTSENFNVDLNKEAQPYEDEDDIDWEDG